MAPAKADRMLEVTHSPPPSCNPWALKAFVMWNPLSPGTLASFSFGIHPFHTWTLIFSSSSWNRSLQHFSLLASMNYSMQLITSGTGATIFIPLCASAYQPESRESSQMCFLGSLNKWVTLSGLFLAGITAPLKWMFCRFGSTPGQLKAWTSFGIKPLWEVILGNKKGRTNKTCRHIQNQSFCWGNVGAV